MNITARETTHARLRLSPLTLWRRMHWQLRCPGGDWALFSRTSFGITNWLFWEERGCSILWLLMCNILAVVGGWCYATLWAWVALRWQLWWVGRFWLMEISVCAVNYRECNARWMRCGDKRSARGDGVNSNKRLFILYKNSANSQIFQVIQSTAIPIGMINRCHNNNKWAKNSS